MNQAYAPYSKFNVGAALRLSDDSVIVGNNQENVAYPSGLCAERVALFHAGAVHPDKEVISIAIVATGDLVKPTGIISPCGACRQVMIESERRQHKSLRILLVAENNEVLVFHSAADLLPMSFGSE
jgi:cytidine deaminase